ncbi:MAG: hypothetical protein VKJ66_06655 [Synechococcus sp.]|nr:hypothetical protein [Synechococcus sp.]
MAPANAVPTTPPPEPASRWHRGVLRQGHGVASGRAPNSPYPAGTIALQTPHFALLGLDLSDFHPGTLNLDFAPGEWRLADPDQRVEQLAWSALHPPETFSFWRVLLRPSPAMDPVEALVYYPHPETKQRHWQRPGVLELLAPWIPELRPGVVLELGVDPRRCRLIQPAVLRARLLEFLKFRVLAAQEAFFTDLRLEPEARSAAEGPSDRGAGTLDPERVRAWLRQVGWREALDLGDDDLLATLEQARQLYL